MRFTNLRYDSADSEAVVGLLDGEPVGIPATPGNRHWDQIVAQAIPIAQYAAPPKTRSELDQIAEDEFYRRALIVAGLKGLQTPARLDRAWNRFRRTGDARNDPIDVLDDKLVTLVDAIESAPDHSAIDPTAEKHWS